MPVNPNAAIEITAFRWVPDSRRALVRDLRVRWALEEAGLDYRVRLLDQNRPPDYLRSSRSIRSPCFSDGEVQIFESGAIVQYIGEQTESSAARRQAGHDIARFSGPMAALNSVEPAIFNLLLIDIFYAGEEWAKLRRPGAEDFVKVKLKRVSDWLGDKEWLEGRFTIGDLMMVTVLRFLRHTELVAEFPNLSAYLKRGEARPAFQRALADQLANYAANEPQPEGAAA